jgi:hypothetical protein
MNPQLHTKIERRIVALRTELAELEVAAKVIANFNGNGKLKVMDKHVRTLSDLDDKRAEQREQSPANQKKWRERTKEEKRAYWRKQSQIMRDAKAAKRVAVKAAEATHTANLPPPPFDLNQLPIERLRTTDWQGETSYLTKNRPLLLLDLMREANVPATHENFSYVYRDVLKWGTRPLSQASRFRLAKHTDAKGWRLLTKGEEIVAEVKKLLAAG